MDKHITNYNPAFSSNYKLEITGANYVNYFLQSVNFPGVSNSGLDVFYKHNQTVTYNNSTDWGPLNCVALMDEEFENYIYLHSWMRSFIDDDDWHNLVKDIKLHILSRKQINFINIHF
jgi:hypothetical protein